MTRLLLRSTLLNSMLFGLLLCAVLTLCQAQTKQVESAAAAPQNVAPPLTQQTTTNEDFELNITERRISEENYEAATSIAIGSPESGINVRIGVGVAAEKIDVLLRNVRGQIRFRTSLELTTNRLNRRRTSSTTNVVPPPASPPAP